MSLQTPSGRVPDFVGFGVHRSGSTWLSDQLGQHPAIWTPAYPLKEVHFFDELHVPQHRKWHETRLPALQSMIADAQDAPTSAATLDRVTRLHYLAEADRTDDWYRAVFGLADDAATHVGEITPAYSLLGARAMNHLLELNPEVRVFIVFRDPAERIWSHVKLALKSEILADPSVLSDAARITAVAGRKGAVDRTRYRRALKNLEKTFRPDQVLVAFYDQVVEAPGMMLREVANHIGVDPDAFPLRGLRQPLHNSPEGEVPDWLRSACQKAYRADVEWLADRFGGYPARWLDD